MTERGGAIVLVGMMGSGKTTVGRRLAAELGAELADSDHQVEERTGATVAEIWATRGEDAFRALESEALEAIVGDTANTGTRVVAAAGGVVLDPRNRRLLAERATRVIWLRARPATLAGRIGADPGHRPLLDRDPVGTLQRLDRERRDLYAEVATDAIDVDDLSPDEVVASILGLLPSGLGGDDR